MNKELKQILPPLLVVVAFIFVLVVALTGKMNRADAALEHFCTKTMPAAVSVVVPERVWHSNLNPRKWVIHYNWKEIQKGEFPRR